ncbi:MAG: pilus assembly protein PilM [Dehalococcoidales bacterium]|nr:MAG: pilus assembly protein PilM [Dehalococcoidales bacterium]
MARKVVTLYIDDTSIRLLITDGKNITERAHSPLEPGLVEGGVVAKEEEVAARIVQLLKDRQVRTKKVNIGLSGLHSLTLVIDLPQLPENMLAEAVMREASKVLPVPLEQLYLTWKAIPAPERKIRIFVIAIPRNTADALLKTLRKAELTPYMMDIKSLALARMVNEPTAIVLDVQPTEYDIVIIGDGMPQPIRTIPISPDERLSWQKKLPMITDDLTRTMEFYDSRNPDNPLVPSIPIYVSGELADEPEICQSLSDRLGRSVTRLSLPVSYPLGSYPSRYTVNLGLALKQLASRSKTASLVADMDVLPPAYQPKSFSIARVLALTAAAVAVAVIVSQITFIGSNAAGIESLDNQLETINEIVEQNQQRQLEERQVLSQVQISQGTFTTALETLNTQRNDFNVCLEVATSCLTDEVTLSSISHDGDTLMIEIQSQSESGVLQYARNLKASGIFSEVSIVNMKKLLDGGMMFRLTLGIEE